MLYLYQKQGRHTTKGEKTMKYIVEDWTTDEILKVFDTSEDREAWLRDNVNYYSDGGYLDDGRKISIYEEA